MLTEEQNKLLQRYRDMAYVMNILCSECSDFYSLINNIFKFPIIISSSIMIIFNSKDTSENMQLANIILNVSTTLILSLVSNFKLNERIINFTNASKKMNKLCHKIEDYLYNNVDDITTDNLRECINEYDYINDNVEYPYISHIKNKLIKNFKNKKTLPNVLNCTSNESPATSDLIITNI